MEEVSVAYRDVGKTSVPFSVLWLSRSELKVPILSWHILLKEGPQCSPKTRGYPTTHLTPSYRVKPAGPGGREPEVTCEEAPLVAIGMVSQRGWPQKCPGVNKVGIG